MGEGNPELAKKRADLVMNHELIKEREQPSMSARLLPNKELSQMIILRLSALTL